MSGDGWGSGWDNQAVLFALAVIIESGISGSGLFVYSGPPGAGNPPIDYITAPGVADDNYGNALPTTTGGFTSARYSGLTAEQVAQLSAGVIRLGASGPTSTYTLATIQVPNATAYTLVIESPFDTVAAPFPVQLEMTSGATAAGAQFLLSQGGAVPATSALVEIHGGTAIGTGTEFEFWLLPSGDTTGATDSANLTAAFGVAPVVNLLPGTFYVDAPIVPPTGSSLIGGGCIINNSLRSSAVTTIKATSTFAGTGVVEQITVAATPIGNFTMSGIHFDLSAAPNTTHWIYAFSNVYGNNFRDLSCLGPAGAGTGIGMNLVFDGTSGQPDGWSVDNMLVMAMGNVIFAQAGDMIWNKIHGIQSVGDGARIRTLANSLISNSRMANGGGRGWNFGDSGTGSAGPDGTLQVANCDSQINQGTGLYVDWPAAGGQMLNITGYTSVNDGQDGASPGVSILGGSSAGMTDISALTVAANGTGPVTAFSAAGASNWSLAAGSLWAVTNPLVNASTGVFEYRALVGKIGAGAWAAIADSDADTHVAVSPAQNISAVAFPNPVTGATVPVGIGHYRFRCVVNATTTSAAGTPQLEFTFPSASGTMIQTYTPLITAGNAQSNQASFAAATSLALAAGPTLNGHGFVCVWEGDFTTTAAGNLALGAITSAGADPYTVATVWLDLYPVN